MMNEEQMLYCLIAFILGWLVSRHMGNGFRVGGWYCPHDPHVLALTGFNAAH